MESSDPSSTSTNVNVNMDLNKSLDDIIQERRKRQQSQSNQQKNHSRSKKRTPIKNSRNKRDNSTDTATPTEKAIGTSRARRNAKLAAKRGVTVTTTTSTDGNRATSKSSKATPKQIQTEIARQHQTRSSRSRKHPYAHSYPPKACSVYVGNLSYSTTWQTLKDYMRQAGNILHADILTSSSENGQPRSKGCGIVVYEHYKDAMRAMKDLNDGMLDGRKVFIREDRDATATTNASNTATTTGSGLAVFVGNLSYETKWQELKDHMRKAGNVDKADIKMTPEGKSRGCAMVIYQHPKEAMRAIRELDGSVLEGRTIFVREDRGERDRDGHGGANMGGGGGRNNADYRNDRRAAHAPTERNNTNHTSGHNPTQLYVGNIPYSTTWQNLKDFFNTIGSVERADVIEGTDGRKKGFGIVRYRSEHDAHVAIQRFHGVDFDGRILEVRLDHRS